MEVILLQRVEKLGQLGDVVKVKDGYARNFLLPQRKALRSTPENKAKFAVERADMEKVNAHRRGDAQSEAAALEGKVCVLLRQASENGHLYGSVTARDIAETVSSLGIKIDRTQVRLDKAIKALGVHPLRVYLHPEVPANVRVIIARSEAEAETQKQALAGGGAAAVAGSGSEEAVAAEAFFEEGAGPAEDGEEAVAEEASAEKPKKRAKKAKSEADAE